jgi:hypothetical protein
MMSKKSGVSMDPGAIAFTRTLLAASSLAATLVMPTTPHFPAD